MQQLTNFQVGHNLPKTALVSLLLQQYPNASPATLDWHIHRLLERGQLVRRGRGQYVISQQYPELAAFSPTLPPELERLGKQIGKAFPYLTTCVWSTAVVHSFTVQQPFVSYWLIEVEREAVGSVLDFVLRQRRTGTLRKASILRAEDIQLTQRYTPEAAVYVLIKPLVSEAPLQQDDASGLNVPTAEKLLVDLVADTRVFDLFAEELPNIYTQLNDRYVLNLDKLRRYARRRNRLPSVDEYLNLLPTPHDS
jgi:hypothetical protein